MAGNKKFNESAFRAQLRDSLREVNVSEALREKTLKGCRDWLLAEESVHMDQPETDKPVIDEGRIGNRRTLSFPARYATALRIAGGVAACVLLVVMLYDLMPKTGRQAPSLAMADRSANEAVLAADAAGASEGQAEFGVPNTAVTPDAALAKSLPPEASAVAGATHSAAVSAASAGADALGGSSDTAAAPEMMLALDARYQSWGGGTWTEALLPEPNAGILATVSENLEFANPALDIRPEHIFPVMHLKSALTADMMAQSASWANLIGKAGLWMVPAKSDVGWSLFPVLTGPAESSAIQVHLGEALFPLGSQNWLNTLSDSVLLKQAIKKAVGTEVTSWTILDVHGGNGYWVCWTTDGQDWVMPFMDTPEALHLVNGVAYPYSKLKANVVPRL